MKLTVRNQFTSLDFQQASIHVAGLSKIVAARGGVSTVEDGLMRMISWYGSSYPVGDHRNALTDHRRVDITAALLHNTTPLFPLLACGSNSAGLGTLPAPLLSLVNSENAQTARFMNSTFHFEAMDARDQRLMRVVACLGDLNALAAQVRYELARGTDVWHDGERIDSSLNPVTHQLLNLPLQRAGLSHWDVVS